MRETGGPATVSSWILRLAESRTNYWATFAVDLSLMTFFLAWDAAHTQLHAATIFALFLAGIGAWTLSEYTFHRWVYHLGFALFRSGHEKHHDDPKAYLAIPWFVTPLLFLPVQLVVSGWYGAPGFSALLAGWFCGFIAYGLLHHSLHHYTLKYSWFRHLQSQHRVHHALPDTNFGVTMRFWDRVFGTEFTKEDR